MTCEVKIMKNVIYFVTRRAEYEACHDHLLLISGSILTWSIPKLHMLLDVGQTMRYPNGKTKNTPIGNIESNDQILLIQNDHLPLIFSSYFGPKYLQNYTRLKKL